MSEISINVTIADREYPLKVTQQEEPNIRKAVQVINDRIIELKKSYGLKDRQDYLAMCLLQFVAANTRMEGYNIESIENINERLASLDDLISNFLDKIKFIDKDEIVLLDSK